MLSEQLVITVDIDRIRQVLLVIRSFDAIEQIIGRDKNDNGTNAVRRFYQIGRADDIDAEALLWLALTTIDIRHGSGGIDYVRRNLFYELEQSASVRDI